MTDIDIDVYEYRQQARRPVVWLAAMVTGFLLGLMIWNTAPWYIWLVWVPASVVLLVYLVRNPVTGLRITQDALTLSPWQVPQVIALKDVRFVRIVDWTDSTDIEVHLRDGTATRLQDADIPPRRDFVAALAARGVPVEEV